MKLTTNSSQETQKLASDLAEKILHQDGPVVIALIGNLGSGKTTFTQGFIKALGVQEKVSSPTFILSREYQLTNQSKFQKVIHLDLYRLESQLQIQGIGLNEHFSNPENIILIEWADRLQDSLPDNSLQIYFENNGENTRTIEVRD